jgi:glycosyltransferase involved in cell wall biosynthesis
MKIILFANTDWYLYNFRRSLAERLRADGWEVVLVSPPGEYGEQLAELGFRWIPVPFSTRSANPLHELFLIKRLIQLYRQERPDLVHHFTIKCVLYGTIAAKLIGGIKIVNAVTGLGHVFTDPGLKARLVRPVVRGLYRLALSGNKVRVIYQNSDDRDSFVGWGLVARERTRLIRGSGVDVLKFAGRGTRDEGRETPITNHQSRITDHDRPITNHQSQITDHDRPFTNHQSQITDHDRPFTNHQSQITDHDRPVTILFASRLLREKGIFELIEAFKVVRAKHPQAELLIAGDLYLENPSSLTTYDVDALKKTEGVSFLGHIDDMQPLLTDCDIVVLPSYREGTPRILIEAAAMEKPIVATDIAGCRGLVEDGQNGFLVPVKDVAQLADAMDKLVADPEMRVRMGSTGRQIVLDEFDEQIVIEKTMGVYCEL